MQEKNLRCTKKRSKKGYKKSYSPFVNVEGAFDDETDPLLHIGKDKVTNCGDENEKGYGIEYFDSSDNGSLVGSDADDVNAGRRKSRFPQYNPNVEVSEFCIGMVFRDGKQFKEAVRKYSRCVRRELKFMKNEPKRIRVKCIASAKCLGRIFASYNKQARGIQVKSFQE